MIRTTSPALLLVSALAGWLNQERQRVLDYLREENRVLREQPGTKRLRLTDRQRRRLAALGHAIGRPKFIGGGVQRRRDRVGGLVSFYHRAA